MAAKYHRYLTVFLISILLNLTGCVNSLDTAPSAIAKGIVLGAITGGTFGVAGGFGFAKGAMIGGSAGGMVGYVSTLNAPLLKQLRQKGVVIIEVGDEVVFILPSDMVFDCRTPRLNCYYFSVLDMLIHVMNCFEKITVKVASHTDCCGPEDRNLAMTRQQASNLAHYLWVHGADARILFPVGYGSAFPIATNETPSGKAMNRRIEITFRKLPVVEE